LIGSHQLIWWYYHHLNW